MRNRKLRFCAVPLLLVPFSLAKSKTLPKLVVSAQYVMVTTECGDPYEQPLNPHISPGDRLAVADVQRALEKWGRYSVAVRPQDADLILVVRKGRVADATLGAQVHVRPRQTNQPDEITPPDPDNPCAEGGGPNPPGVSVHPESSANVGDPQDMLALYSTALGGQNNAPPIWRGRGLDGLKAPGMVLVQELRAKVEAAAKAP